MKIFRNWFLKWLLLSVLWFVLNSIDFLQLQLNEMNQPAILGRAIMSVLDSLILCWILAKSSMYGYALAFRIFLAVFGMKIVLTVVEAVYLPDLRPIITPLIFNGVVSCLLWVLTAVAMTVGFVENSDPSERIEKLEWKHEWYQWILFSIILALVWMVLFVMFGGIVFINVAKLIDPIALETYTHLDIPAWVLPFQGLRALLWLVVALPLLSQLQGKYGQAMILSACIFAGWMGSNLCLAINHSAGLQYAHLVEVMAECFTFGVLVFLILARKGQPSIIHPN